MLKNKKYWLIIGILAIIAAGVGYYQYSSLLVKNVSQLEKPFVLLVPEGSDFDSVVDSLVKNQVLSDIPSFKRAASLLKYGKNGVPTGRFLIKNGLTNKEILDKLRHRKQDAAKVVFNNVRKVENLAAEISQCLATDSATLLSAILKPEILTKLSLDTQNVMTAFIPNTYEMYWTTEPDKVVERLIDETSKFWSQEGREEKLKALDMSKAEVYTLASIVEKETNLKSERPTLAAVYLNRLRLGMPLQADPTVVYASGDFDLRRVLEKHLAIDSPYNTYKYAGLPPGPIFMPSINSIDAVLANVQHDYIFFCAKPGYDGGHAFAKTFSEHGNNARVYRDWLDKENIK